MRLTVLLLGWLLLVPLTGSGQIHWMSFPEALAKSKTTGKKIFVFVHTDWCGWCRRMEHTTYLNPKVVRTINRYYLPVKFNAESRAPISFKGKTYKFVHRGRGGYHDLAAQLLDGKMTYPTLVFLDEHMNLIQAIPGYRKAGELVMIADYFGSNAYRSIPWETYQKRHHP